MDPKWLILIFAAITHLNLLLAFLPSYWDPVRRNGRKLSTLAGPLLMPTLLGAVLLVALLDNWATLPEWSRIVGGFGVGAATATLVINLTVLRSVEAGGP